MKSVMTPFPYSVEEDAAVENAVEMMAAHGIRHLPVKRGDDLVGVVSDRDIKRALDPASGLPPRGELRVQHVMLADPYVVDVTVPLDGVLLTLAQEHLGCALVVKNGRLAGIFTATDACRLFGKYLRSTRLTGGDDAA